MSWTGLTRTQVHSATQLPGVDGSERRKTVRFLFPLGTEALIALRTCPQSTGYAGDMKRD